MSRRATPRHHTPDLDGASPGKLHVRLPARVLLRSTTSARAGRNRRDSLPSTLGCITAPEISIPRARLNPRLRRPPDGPRSHPAPHMPRNPSENRPSGKPRPGAASHRSMCFGSSRGKALRIRSRKPSPRHCLDGTGIFPGARCLHVTGLARGLVSSLGVVQRPRAGWKDRNSRHSRQCSTIPLSDMPLLRHLPFLPASCLLVPGGDFESPCPLRGQSIPRVVDISVSVGLERASC